VTPIGVEHRRWMQPSTGAWGSGAARRSVMGVALAAVSCLSVMLAFGQAAPRGLWREVSLGEASQWARRQTPTLRTNG
jgi:hypothetical protein